MCSKTLRCQRKQNQNLLPTAPVAVTMQRSRCHLGFHFKQNWRSPIFHSETLCPFRVPGYFFNDLESRSSLHISEELFQHVRQQRGKHPCQQHPAHQSLQESHPIPGKLHWLPLTSREKIYLCEINGRLWAFKQTDTHLGFSVYKPKPFCNKTNAYSG